MSRVLLRHVNEFFVFQTLIVVPAVDLLSWTWISKVFYTRIFPLNSSQIHQLNLSIWQLNLLFLTSLLTVWPWTMNFKVSFISLNLFGFNNLLQFAWLEFSIHNQMAHLMKCFAYGLISSDCSGMRRCCCCGEVVIFPDYDECSSISCCYVPCWRCVVHCKGFIFFSLRILFFLKLTSFTLNSSCSSFNSVGFHKLIPFCVSIHLVFALKWTQNDLFA